MAAKIVEALAASSPSVSSPVIVKELKIEYHFRLIPEGAPVLLFE